MEVKEKKGRVDERDGFTREKVKDLLFKKCPKHFRIGGAFPPRRDLTFFDIYGG